jgi:hypothetical protein
VNTAQTGSNPTNHTPEEPAVSYDIWLEIDTGSEDLATVAEVGNYTANVSGMWATALGHSLGDLDGTNAGAAVEPLAKAVAAMEATPDLYRAIGPANGWGSYDGALGYLRTLRDLCSQHPKTTIRISR